MPSNPNSYSPAKGTLHHSIAMSAVLVVPDRNNRPKVESSNLEDDASDTTRSAWRKFSTLFSK